VRQRLPNHLLEAKFRQLAELQVTGDASNDFGAGLEPLERLWIGHG
jgi:hypothetical protein